MRKILLLQIMLFNLVIFAQNRTNESLPIISKTIDGQIISAQGWLKNSSGQWVSRKNKIISDLGTDTNILENYEKYSTGTDNFISFERREIKIKDSTYILLLKKYRDGYYTYESIEKGWNPKTSCKYYVLEKDEIGKIENIEHNVLNNLHLNILYSGDLKYIDLKTLTNAKIANEINKHVINPEKQFDKLALNIYCFDDKKLVQFYFYDYFTYEGNEENKYYETSISTFNQFVNID